MYKALRIVVTATTLTPDHSLNSYKSVMRCCIFIRNSEQGFLSTAPHEPCTRKEPLVCLLIKSLGLFQAEARLAAKRAARAEAREIRMKELERQQKEVTCSSLLLLFTGVFLCSRVCTHRGTCPFGFVLNQNTLVPLTLVQGQARAGT